LRSVCTARLIYFVVFLTTPVFLFVPQLITAAAVRRGRARALIAALAALCLRAGHDQIANAYVMWLCCIAVGKTNCEG
jgi:hypothetical protein